MRCSPILLFALLSCSDQRPVPRVERVELGPPPARVAEAKMVKLSRTGVASVTSDVRDAWTIPIGTDARVELSVPAGSSFSLVSACGALVRDRAQPPVGRVRLSIGIRGATPARTECQLDLAELARIWTPLSLDAKSPGGVLELELSAEWVGAPPLGSETIRAAFELPVQARRKPDTSTAAPNVLIVSVDTLRADRLGCYGNKRGLTPHLDLLATRGVRFANAYSSAPWTLPSYGSLFTGLLPAEHRAGIVTQREALFGKDVDAPAKVSTERLRSDVPTLAEAFAAAGWSTAMFQSNPYLSRVSGLDRGFEQYVSYGVNARHAVDLALEWIDKPRSAPFFFVLHLMDPHYPYAPPTPYDERFAGRTIESLHPWPPNLSVLRKGPPVKELAKLCEDMYDGEVAFTDAEIGRLLRGLEERQISANTLVVLHSDHGEEFWEHGSCDHGHTQHEELLRVPLVLSMPGRVPQGQVVDTRVRALDLFPTLCQLCGLPAPDRLDGATLVPLFQDSGEPRAVLAEAVHSGAREIKALLSDRYKLIVRGGTDDRLYDLAIRTDEREDCSSSEPNRARAMRQQLLQHHARSFEAARSAQVLEAEADVIERIHQIGYVGSPDAPPPK